MLTVLRTLALLLRCNVLARLNMEEDFLGVWRHPKRLKPYNLCDHAWNAAVNGKHPVRALQYRVVIEMTIAERCDIL